MRRGLRIAWPAGTAKSAAAGSKRFYLSVSLDDALADLVGVVEAENRSIFAWSSHDLDCIKKHCRDRGLARLFEMRVQNAIPIAKAGKEAVTRPWTSNHWDHPAGEPGTLSPGISS